MKYSKEFKLECIQKYKNGIHIEDPPGTKHKHFHDQVLKWVRIFDSIGEIGLEHNKPALSIEQRIELIKRVEDGESYRSVALSIGIGTDLLIKWCNIYRQDGIDGLKSLKRGKRPMTNKETKKDKSKSELEQLKEELEYLRAENAYLKKLDTLVQKGGPTTKEKVIVIDELGCKFTLKVLLKVSGLPKSTYEYYKSSKHLNYEKRKKEEDEQILAIIKPVFEHHKLRYGVRRIILACKDELKGINHKRIEKIMSLNNLKAVQGKNGKYHSYKGDNGDSKENLLLHKEVDEGKHTTQYVRDFETSKPNEKWTTDVSEFKSNEGKVYLSPILDMYDRSIISYDISISPDFSQTKRMIDQAFNQYPNLEGLIFHSDQGWQYQQKTYRKWLSDRGIKQSYSRKGNCMDNSLMENFFGIMKNEMYYGHEKEFKTREQLKAAMIEYIEYYNNERINTKEKD